MTNLYRFYSTKCKNREGREDQVANEFFKPIGLMGYTSRSQNVLLLLAALKQVL
ncbi:MAG: hypothetical protein VKK42_11330 [Lyngbya sp.]|nr:hypothetical protein [Lyngbya sp.]